MQFPNFTGAITKFLTDNATTLLTAGGVVGVVGTGVLAGRATLKARDTWVDHVVKHQEDAVEYDLKSDGAGQFPQLTKLDYVRIAGPHFIPPVLAGAATIGMIVYSHKLSAGKIAALAAAYGLSQNQLEDYKTKVRETLTKTKADQIDEKIAQDQVNQNPPQGQVLILNEGQVLCYDTLSGRYFQSTVDKIRKAENSVNKELFHHQICSLSHFYDQLTLKPTELSDGLGWNMSTSDDRQLIIEITAVTTDDETKPCFNIGYNMLPKPGYEQQY